MQEILTSLRRLVADGRLHRALERALEFNQAGQLELAPEARNEIGTQSARLARLERRSRQGLVSQAKVDAEMNRITQAVLGLLDEVESRSGEADSDEPAGAIRPSVFLSYSSRDRAAMEKLEAALTAEGLEVLTDVKSFDPETSLTANIENALRTATATLCQISRHSLLSDWVGFEILIHLGAETLTQRRRFFAGFTDDAFFKPSFRLELTVEIDQKLEELDRIAAEQRARQLDVRNIDCKRDRLIQLRHGLGTILERLNEHLTLDLRPDEFQASIKRFVAVVRRLHEGETA